MFSGDAGKRYCDAVPRPGAFAASMETVQNQGVAILAAAFSCGAAQMINLI
jgi:hypothetical protein